MYVAPKKCIICTTVENDAKKGQKNAQILIIVTPANFLIGVNETFFRNHAFQKIFINVHFFPKLFGCNSALESFCPLLRLNYPSFCTRVCSLMLPFHLNLRPLSYIFRLFSIFYPSFSPSFPI